MRLALDCPYKLFHSSLELETSSALCPVTFSGSENCATIGQFKCKIETTSKKKGAKIVANYQYFQQVEPTYATIVIALHLET
jgi:hypothetical protein